MGEFSVWHLLIVMGIVLLVFGPSRLPGLGHSLGKAIRGFKEGMKSLDTDTLEEKTAQRAPEKTPEAPSALPPADKSQTVATAPKEKTTPTQNLF